VKVKLEAWAAARYDPAPSLWVLRRWCRDGEIYPPPELVGRNYYVESNARRTTESRAPLLDRIKAEA
jgi:predicted site-specific integrase-resolvase